MQKAIEHFAKSLKIKGLGPSAIEKLQINTIPEIYELTEDEVVAVLGDKTGSKLYAEIQQSKSASLNQLLTAFGIPLVGKTASAKLCSVIRHIDEISEQTCKEAGLGPKVTSNLLTWFETEFKPCLTHLEFTFEAEAVASKSKGVICITGKLNSFKSKEAAKVALETAGYEVKSSVTKDVNILVNESGIESAKTQKARDSGVVIVTNIFDLI